MVNRTGEIPSLAGSSSPSPSSRAQKPIVGLQELHKQVAASSDNQEPPQKQEQLWGPIDKQVTTSRRHEQQQQQPPFKRLSLLRRQLFCGFLSPSLSVEERGSLHDQENLTFSSSSSSAKSQPNNSSLVYHSESSDKKTGSRETRHIEKQQQQQIIGKNRNNNNEINKISTILKPATPAPAPTPTPTTTTTNTKPNSLLTYFGRKSARKRYQLGDRSREDESNVGHECCISLSGFQRSNRGINLFSSSPMITNSMRVDSRNEPQQQSKQNSSGQQSIGAGINQQFARMIGINSDDTSMKRQRQRQREQQNQQNQQPNNHLKNSSSSLKLIEQREVLESIGSSPNGVTIMAAHQQHIFDQFANERSMLTSQNNLPVLCPEVMGVSLEKSSTTTAATALDSTVTTNTRSNAKVSSGQAANSLRQSGDDSKIQEHDQMNLLISLLNQFAKQQEQLETQWSRVKEGSSLESEAEVDPYYLEENWTSFVQLNSQNHCPSATTCAEQQRLHNPDSLDNAQPGTVTKDRNKLANLKIQQDAIWELLTTEVFYLKRLKVIIDLFLNTLFTLQRASLLLEVSSTLQLYSFHLFLNVFIAYRFSPILTTR